MGLFYFLPDWLGLIAFNLLNAMVLAFALLRLPLRLGSGKFILLYLLLELGISLSMTQTNALIAELIILAFSRLEKNQPFWAALFISLTVFIKLFGIVAFALGLLYPSRFRFAAYCLFWIAVLTSIPLITIPLPELMQQYRNWLVLLKSDHDASYGLSFMGWMHTWFKLELPKMGTVLAAAMVFCLPLVRLRLYRFLAYRLHILASILLWMVIFNHKGENPTYIIAMSGIAVWYFSQTVTTVNKTLLWLAFIFTTCSSTDLITPGWIAEKYVEPLTLKTILSCIIWGKLTVELLWKKEAAFVNQSNEQQVNTDQ